MTRAASVMAVIRSWSDCALGSPVEPPSEMPCEPESSCQLIRRRRPSVSSCPSPVNGVTTGAMDPRRLGGSLRNLMAPARLLDPPLDVVPGLPRIVYARHLAHSAWGGARTQAPATKHHHHYQRTRAH